MAAISQAKKNCRCVKVCMFLCLCTCVLVWSVRVSSRQLKKQTRDKIFQIEIIFRKLNGFPLVPPKYYVLVAAKPEKYQMNGPLQMYEGIFYKRYSNIRKLL